jgi:hypothetical protein
VGDRRTFQHRKIKNAAVNRTAMPTTPAAAPIPIAAEEERHDGICVGVVNGDIVRVVVGDASYKGIIGGIML